MNKFVKHCFIVLFIFLLQGNNFGLAQSLSPDQIEKQNLQIQNDCLHTCIEDVVKIQECSTSSIIENYINEELEAKK